MKRLFLLTGHPGVGKTSVLLRTANELKNRGFKTGGMISREVREGGIRVGFEIIDFLTHQRGWLAHVSQPSGPKIGKYRVNLVDLRAIGVNSILDAIGNMEMIIIDEIGPMELESTAFREVLTKAVESEKPVLGTIHYGLRDSLLDGVKNRKDAVVFEVTRDNRETLHEFVIERILQFSKKPA